MYMCARSISFVHVFTIILLDVRTVLTVWYFVFFIYIAINGTYILGIKMIDMFNLYLPDLTSG